MKILLRSGAERFWKATSCLIFMRGAQILAGHKSVAYSITFRAKYHTLTDDEVNAVMKKILNGLEGMGIQLRA